MEGREPPVALDDHVVARRARLQESLATAAGTLASPLPPDEIVSRLVGAYTHLLDPVVCGVALVDPAQSVMTTVSSRNTPKLEPMPVSEVPAHLVSILGETWAVDKRPVDLPDDPWLADLLGARRAGVGWYLALPLLCEGHTRGGVLLGFDAETGVDAEERAAAHSLAAIGAAALERHALLEDLDRQLRRLDVLYRLSTSLAGGADAPALAAKLNELLSTHGVEVVGIAFRDRRLARHFGSFPAGPNGADGTAGQVAVSMRLGGRLVGTLRVRPGALGEEQVSFLEALAGELAEVAMRGALRAEVEEAARERAVAAERERFASDLHDTAGQLFVALGLLARRLAEDIPPDSPWAGQVLHLADLADRGNDQIDHAIRALAFLPVAKQGLHPSLRALARSVSEDSGLPISVTVDGRVARLPAATEQALYRVVHEAIANAWRHARCETIRVDLVFGAHEVAVRVVDDGVGIRSCDPDGGLHLGIASMQRAVEEIGGTLKIEPATPRGTLVEARTRRTSR